MKITQSYKYRKDGIIYVSGTLPEGVEIIETMDILNSEEGFDLVRISDDENVGTSIWLRDGDVQENYKEVEHKEPQEDENG